MIAHKHITKILIALVTVAVTLCMLAVCSAEQLAEALGGRRITIEYESKLFDTSEIIDIDILMDDDQWDEMLANAIQEEYYLCDVVINGTIFKNVGIRPKGNTSLTTIVNDPNTDRYSFKIEFDQYVKKQTCWGLDKLVLNNSYADYTYMKEALVYDMYQYIGADASLYNYAKISVNGEYWGVYLALEAVEDSFLLRNYGTNRGDLYKPDSMGGRNVVGGNPGVPGGGDMDFGEMRPPEDQGNRNNRDFPVPEFDGSMPMQGENSSPDRERNENRGELNFDLREMQDRSRDDFFPRGGGGGLQMGGGGANLNYSDDELESYATIWEGKVTKTSDRDHRRVVTALKNISNGVELENYMDVDNLLKYIAVHIFSVNDDSLSGSMAHNYYLYEEKGRLNIIPWDYNLALGGMNGGAATDVVNDAIDMPFSATRFFDALLENEEYLAQYHEYLGQLVDEYIYSGAFDAFYNRTRSQIDALVQADPTAFCTYEEYLTAADTLYQLVQLRGDSIRGQLAGTIPSTESGQRADSSGMIDASGIDLSSMGTMFGARGGGGFRVNQPGNPTGNWPGNPSAEPESLPEGLGSIGPGDGTREGFEPPTFGGGRTPGNLDPSAEPENLPEGLGSIGPGDGTREGFEPPTFEGGRMPGNLEPSASENFFQNSPRLEQSGTSSSNTTKNLVTYGIYLMLLIAGLIFVKLYRKRPYRYSKPEKR